MMAGFTLSDLYSAASPIQTLRLAVIDLRLGAVSNPQFLQTGDPCIIVVRDGEGKRTLNFVQNNGRRLTQNYFLTFRKRLGNSPK